MADRSQRTLMVLLALIATAVFWGAGCGGSRISVPRSSDRYEFESGRVAYESKHWLDAQTHLKRFLDVHPGHAAADSAQFLLGMAQYNIKSFAEAAVEFAILVREFPRSTLLDQATYQECLCYEAQMSDAQLDPTFAFRSRACLNEFILRYADSPLREEAREHLSDIANLLAEKEFLLGMMWTKTKRYRAGIIYFDEVLQKYPSSVWVPDTLYWKARCHRHREQYDEAIKLLRLLVENFPDHKVTGPGKRELQHLERTSESRERDSERAERRPQ